ncbi:MAG: hypothetical protein GY795_28715 [Desulfobacterales bacterium]|nr:hypothetical protein [Desulfobacterales bacterium]
MKIIYNTQIPMAVTQSMGRQFFDLLRLGDSMLKKILIFSVFVAFMHILCLTDASGTIPGDIDDSGNIDLYDATVALQICAGYTTYSADIHKKADADGNGRIGLAEALLALQVASGIKTVLTNKIDENRMLIVITAPSVNDEYYKDSFSGIIDFDIRYAKAVVGKDNIVVLADNDTLPYLKGKLPEDILLESEIQDIWMRDFTTVLPSKMIQFVYDRPDEAFIQKSFDNFAERYGLEFEKSDLKLDGGNVVDNNNDKIVLTEKILSRNPSLSESQIITKLKQISGAAHAAIIPMDEEFLGHSDGMVMFVSDNKLLVNNYPNDPLFKADVIKALQNGLPGVEITEIQGTGYGTEHGSYASACGIYVNSVVTYNYIYMPVFGKAEDDDAVKTVQSDTDKTVITINAEDVCSLGGNVRCLSWQLTGENARKLIEAAREVQPRSCFE